MKQITESDKRIRDYYSDIDESIALDNEAKRQKQSLRKDWTTQGGQNG